MGYSEVFRSQTNMSCLCVVPQMQQQLPGGSWLASACNYSVTNQGGRLLLQAHLRNRRGCPIPTSTYFNPGDQFENRDGRFVKTYAAPVAMVQPMAPVVSTFMPPVYGQRHVVAATTIQRGYRTRPRARMVNRQVNRAINQQNRQVNHQVNQVNHTVNRQVNRANRQAKRQNRQAMKAMRRGL